MNTERQALRDEVAKHRASLNAAETALAATYGPEVQALASLLAGFFSTDEGRRLFRYALGAEACANVPGDPAPPKVVFRSLACLLSDLEVPRVTLRAWLVEERDRRLAECSPSGRTDLSRLTFSLVRDLAACNKERMENSLDRLGTVYLNLADVAVRAGITPQHLRKLRAAGKGPKSGARKGTRPLFAAAVVDAWVAERAARWRDDTTKGLKTIALMVGASHVLVSGDGALIVADAPESRSDASIVGVAA